MKLKIEDRINILGILPTQGDFLTLSKIKLLRDKLELTEKEMSKWKVQTIIDGERLDIQWDKDAKTEKDIEISDLLAEQITLALDNLDKSKELNLAHLRIYELFTDRKATE